MLNADRDPGAKRAALRDGLASGRLLRFAGAYSPLVAMAVEAAGFDGVYIGGSTLATDLGLPDIGLVSLTEACQRGGAIADATGLATLIDVDTGFGEPINAARTIHELERQGLAGCHLEDQVNPKRCGHLANKALVDTGDMVLKLKAACAARRDPNFLIIARTDSRAVEGFEAAVERAEAYKAAGADMIFPEALADRDEFDRFRQAVSGPLLANMTEFGKSELLNASELEAMGYAIVIYPVTTHRLAMRAVEDGLRSILQHGTQAHLVDAMQTRERLYELIRYDDYVRFDEGVAGR